MKRIDWAEILKDAGESNLKRKLDKQFEHTASSNGESLTIHTKSERVHNYLGMLKQLGHSRFKIFKAMKEKAEKFGGTITVYKKDGDSFLLSVAKNGEMTIQ